MSKQQLVDTQEEQEKKIQEICEWGITKLETLEQKKGDFLEKTESQKKDIIMKLKQKLITEAKVPENKIGAILTHNLKGLVTKQHILKSIEGKFKQTQKRSHKSIALAKAKKENGKTVYHNNNTSELPNRIKYVLDDQELVEKICRGLQAGVVRFNFTGDTESKKIVAVQLVPTMKVRG